MTEAQRQRLRSIKNFAQLLEFLRDELDWPIDQFEDEDDLTFDWSDDLGLKESERIGIRAIKQLRPLETGQPWGIFFIDFEKKRLPIVILRRVLNALVMKKRGSANKAQQAVWKQHDLLFISAYGEDGDRQLTFAHFSEPEGELADNKPTLRVLGWDDDDTNLKLDYVADMLGSRLAWPKDSADVEGWRTNWSQAFEIRHYQVIDTAKDLAQRLAELAQRIRNRALLVLQHESDTGPLRKLMKGFKAALIHDLDEATFADMYAQTITYGLFSAAVSRTVPGAGTALIQEDVVAMIPVTNPFLKEMLEGFLKAGGRKGKLDFDELGIQEVVDLLRDKKTRLDLVLNDFGNRRRDEDPVIHFYEDFLAAYDKGLKVQRGVFYTPQPVVSYIVRSVHEVLQAEFGLTDGLADTATWGEMLAKRPDLKLPPLTDEPGEQRTISSEEPFVQILDPATGTATFLVEVIDVIHDTLVAKWKQQGLGEKRRRDAWNEYVPRHLLPRLHAYELMMAPYAIAHMKIGLKLAETGYRFGSGERARIYLTNALEPWQKQLHLPEFQALAHEAAAVNEIKRNKRFTVVIGNPPYAGHSANASRERNGQLTFIGKLIEDYKAGCPELFKPAQAKWLQDDYVKFLRFAEYVLRASPCRILGVITNHSYLNNPTFRGMRRNLCESFGSIRILDLHGNIKRVEANGVDEKDENVFDIQQGVAIQVSYTVDQARTSCRVLHADLWGARSSKYVALSEEDGSHLEYSVISPKDPLFLFIPRNEDLLPEYERGIRLPEIMSVAGDPAPGIVSTHDEFAFSFTKQGIIKNVEALLATDTEEEARRLFRLCSQDQWNYEGAKRGLANGEWRRKLLAVFYRPFDLRFTVNDANVAVHRRERVLRHMNEARNLAICTNRQVNGDFRHVFCTRNMANDCALSTASKERTYILPLYLSPEPGALDLHNGIRPNFSDPFLSRLSDVLQLSREGDFGLPEGMASETIIYYIYSVLHSPEYRARYAGFLKSDFPRIPLTGDFGLFNELAQLGGKLASLHLLESPTLENLITDFVGNNKEISKIGYVNGTVWIDAGGTKAKPKPGTSGFRGVPEDVWNFQVGGYQVCEKWLKDRKGRTLSEQDVAHYHKIVVALSETIRTMDQIDRAIDEHGGWPGAFQTEGKTA